MQYFAMPMGVAALAFAFQMISNLNVFYFSRGMWVGTGILAAILFCIIFGLYLAKFILYPSKVLKEWDCPMRINSFAMITLTLQLFAGLLMEPNGVQPLEKINVRAAPHMCSLHVVL